MICQTVVSQGAQDAGAKAGSARCFGEAHREAQTFKEFDKLKEVREVNGSLGLIGSGGSGLHVAGRRAFHLM